MMGLMGLVMLAGIAVFVALIGAFLRLFTASRTEVKRKNDEVFPESVGYEIGDEDELVEFIPKKAKRGMTSDE